MVIAIVILSVFVLLVLEIPFDVFVNLSIDRVLLEYQLEAPIKIRGYAYVKNGELFHGSVKKEMGGGVDTLEFLKFVSNRTIVKNCHIRGIFSQDNIENTMMETVMFQNISNVILSIVRKNNPTASLTESYCVAENEDNNIFLQAMLWLSIMDIISILGWYVWKSITNKSGRR